MGVGTLAEEKEEIIQQVTQSKHERLRLHLAINEDLSGHDGDGKEQGFVDRTSVVQRK